MKKQILNLGTALSKAEQKNVFGGYSGELQKLDPNCEIWGVCCGPDNSCTRYDFSITPGGSGYEQGTCVSGRCYY